MKTYINISLCLLTALLLSCSSVNEIGQETSVLMQRPVNIKPTMERPAWPNYDIDNQNSFAIFSDMCTLDSRDIQNKFLWENAYITLYRCNDATYVAFDYLIPQECLFFCFYDNLQIIDADTGDSYLLREVEHFPLNQCFWIHGMTGKYVRFVKVFPPLSDSVRRIQFFDAGGSKRKWFYPSPSRSGVVDIKKLYPKADKNTAEHDKNTPRIIY